MSTLADRAVTPAALRQRRRRAKLAAARELEFVRADWALFLHPDRLPQKAGSPRDRMRAMILKELVDNALDAGATATLAQVDRDTWIVTDDGPGLDRERVLRFFAVNRPMISTKLLRRPTRGALGNGLRVVTGGAAASGGTLTVESRGIRYVLGVDRTTGDTVAIEEGASEITTGTWVTVAFGAALPRGADDGRMAQLAIRCAGPAAEPMLSHLGWYDRAAFAELAQATEPATTRAELAAWLGVALERGGAEPAATAELHDIRGRIGPEPVLLPLGADRFPGVYEKAFRRDGVGGIVPVLVEAWVEAERCPASRGRGTVTLLVNRSPVGAPVRINLLDGRLGIFGCNLARYVERVSASAAYGVVLAVTSPLIPITTEGKEPDLRPMWGAIEAALAKAMRAAHRATRPRLRKGDIKAAAYDVMEDAYREAAGSADVANARQIFYVARRLMQAILPPETVIKDKYFTQHLLPDFIADRPGLTKGWDVWYEARGHLVEPHTGTSVPCGTAKARDYLLPRRHRTRELVAVDRSLYPTLGPENRYATLLYIEKEGFEPLLRKARIAERFDCAIMSSKGMPVTAARLIVDAYGSRGVRILVAHDLDRAGACIAHTLGNDTRRYRFDAAPEIVDIGLSLADARAMGLQDEEAPDAGPKADALRGYGLDEETIGFLIGEGRRYELNAMDTDTFLAWLEDKLTLHGAGKVVPGADVLDRHARRVLAGRRVADRVALLVAEIEAEMAEAAMPLDLAARVERVVAGDPALCWDEALERALADVTPDAA